MIKKLDNGEEPKQQIQENPEKNWSREEKPSSTIMKSLNFRIKKGANQLKDKLFIRWDIEEGSK